MADVFFHRQTDRSPYRDVCQRRRCTATSSPVIVPTRRRHDRL